MVPSMLLYNKAVDYSTLKEGFAIPISYQRQTLETLELNIPRGQKVDVEIEIGGQIYQAILTNIQFDEKNTQLTAICSKFDIEQTET